MKFEAIGKNIIIEVIKEEVEQAFGALDFSVPQADTDRVNAKVISVGSKVKDSKIKEKCEIILFKNKLCNISDTLSVTEEDQIIAVVSEG